MKSIIELLIALSLSYIKGLIAGIIVVFIAIYFLSIVSIPLMLSENGFLILLGWLSLLGCIIGVVAVGFYLIKPK